VRDTVLVTIDVWHAAKKVRHVTFSEPSSALRHFAHSLHVGSILGFD